MPLAGAQNGGMCRSIQTLRPPFHDDPTPEEVRAAALQYVRKVSGFRKPAPHNAQAFDEAVATITAATEALLAGLVVRGAATAQGLACLDRRPAPARLAVLAPLGGMLETGPVEVCMGFTRMLGHLPPPAGQHGGGKALRGRTAGRALWSRPQR